MRRRIILDEEFIIEAIKEKAKRDGMIDNIKYQYEDVNWHVKKIADGIGELTFEFSEVSKPRPLFTGGMDCLTNDINLKNGK